MTHLYLLTALALGFAALPAAPALAQERQETASTTAADALYCEERRLGYWFYCVKPVPAEEPQAPEIEPVAATQELDAITAELRELKARAIVYPTEANVAAYNDDGEPLLRTWIVRPSRA